MTEFYEEKYRRARDEADALKSRSVKLMRDLEMVATKPVPVCEICARKCKMPPGVMAARTHCPSWEWRR